MGEVMVKVVDFPPVSGPPSSPPPQHSCPTWALAIQALDLRLQNPMEAHQRPDCSAAPDLLKCLVGLHLSRVPD